jgi:hypothetical protein
VCTSPANQCFDQSQCGPNESCVAGKCILQCSSNADCRDGFDCTAGLGICGTFATPCTITNDCGSATEVCVGGACVPRSSGGSCPNAGDVWTENGCIPNQAPMFVCQNDGVQDTCATGAICLHHDCWISCDAPNQNACKFQTVANICKPLAEGGTTYQVCASQQMLGGQCGGGVVGDPPCPSGFVCVDGFCK